MHQNLSDIEELTNLTKAPANAHTCETGRVLVVWPHSKMTVQDIQRLTGSQHVQELEADEDGIEHPIVSQVRTAVELLNRAGTSDLRCYFVDEQARSTLYAMADPAFAYALEFDADSLLEFSVHVSHAAHMMTLREELWYIVHYYDLSASPLPNPRTGATAHYDEDGGAEDLDLSAPLARATYQMCLMSYERAIQAVERALLRAW